MKTAGIVLEKANVANIAENPQLWERVYTKLSLRAMPPVGMPVRPTEPEYQSILAYLETGLDKLAEDKPEPGRPTIHRLNRTEYNFTIRDLLGVDSRPADRFPADGGGGGGFDNNADTLFVPPILLERYLQAAG